MAQKRYFFFDIDGTLTDRSTGEIVPSAQKALDQLRDAGHFVAISTGRAYYKAVGFFREHGFTNMVCNGGHGIVINGELVENRPLDYEPALEVYREAVAVGFGVFAAMDDSKKVYGKDFRFYEQAGLRKEPTTYVIDDTFDPADYGAIYKLYIAVPEGQEDQLPGLSAIGHMRFEPQYVMVQPDEKKNGILRVLELVHGSTDQVVVFGDDTNDMDMFDERFYRVAMGNGNDALKARASEVAPANVDDGIYKVCEKNGWFEKVDEA